MVDASPLGLGAILTQAGKVISYASKAHTTVEQRCSPGEREPLAIAWDFHHFRMHLLGSHFKMSSDHIITAYFQQFSFLSICED